MAWASKEDEVLDIVGKQMGVMSLEKKKELSESYSRHIFPQQGLNWTDVQWTTHWGVTFVTLWDEEHSVCHAYGNDEHGTKEVLYCLQ